MALVGAELLGLRNCRQHDFRGNRCPNAITRPLRICPVTASAAPVKLFQHETASIEDDMDGTMTTGRLVQWYPGHIAKAERDLKVRLQLVDVVVEVRDARIPLSTSHPKLDEWIKDKKKILVLNREDMIPTADRNAWATYFSKQGLSVLFTDGRKGKGAMKVMREACTVASTINEKRRSKGLLSRAVRAAVIGYPNVGKSSLINRLMKRRLCDAAPRPGVTRSLKWTTIGEGLDLLDAPGILPMRLDNQVAAVKIAICNDIGESSYLSSGVAAVLFERLQRIPEGEKGIAARYKMSIEEHSAESFLEELAQQLFRGDVNQAAVRFLNDFRKGKLGWFSLDNPPC